MVLDMARVGVSSSFALVLLASIRLTVPQGVAASSHDLFSGGTDATRVLGPIFVEWVAAGNVSGFELSNQTFRCVDSHNWMLRWPSVLNQDVRRCDDYAPGGLRNGFCDYDEGVLQGNSGWIKAKDACPRACGMCCHNYCKGDRRCVASCTAEGAGLADHYEQYLAFLAASVPPQAELNFTMVREQYRASLAGEDYRDHLVVRSLYKPVPFHGGEFLESKNVSIVAQTPGTLIRYTTDGSQPTPMHGTLGHEVVLTRNAMLRAVAYNDEHSASTASHVVSVDIKIRVTSPVITIKECATEDFVINYDQTRQYGGEMCDSARVEVASLRFGSENTLLRYVVNGDFDPPASAPQGQGIVKFTLVESGVITAVAFVPGMTASYVVVSTPINISSNPNAFKPGASNAPFRHFEAESR